MNKAVIPLMIVVMTYLLGDPGMHCLARLGDLKLEEVATAISLLSMPWITS